MKFTKIICTALAGVMAMAMAVPAMAETKEQSPQKGIYLFEKENERMLPSFTEEDFGFIDGEYDETDSYRGELGTLIDECDYMILEGYIANVEDLEAAMDAAILVYDDEEATEEELLNAFDDLYDVFYQSIDYDVYLKDYLPEYIYFTEGELMFGYYEGVYYDYYEYEVTVYKALLEKEKITLEDYEEAMDKITFSKVNLAVYIFEFEEILADPDMAVSAENKGLADDLIKKANAILAKENVTKAEFEAIFNELTALLEKIIDEIVYYEIGDVNRDGKVSMRDIMDMQKYIAFLIEFDEEQIFIGDFNDDGKITMRDVMDLQKYIAGYEW